MVEEVKITEGERRSTSRRSLFIEDEVWAELQELASDLGTSRSQIIREAIADKVWAFRRRRRMR